METNPVHILSRGGIDASSGTHVGLGHAHQLVISELGQGGFFAFAPTMWPDHLRTEGIDGVVVMGVINTSSVIIVIIIINNISI
jgi:hypothetical protein